MVSAAAVVASALCTSSCTQLLRVNDANLASMDAGALCTRYAVSRQPEIRSELARRAVLTDEELVAADTGQIRVGMSDLQLVCSWGNTPIVHNTSDGLGTQQQWVYRPCSGCPANYVYVEDHKIIAIQN
jgi:hypothetical protein